MKTKKINIHENNLDIDSIETERDEPVFWTTKDGNVWQKAQFGMLPIGAKYILQDDLNDKVRTDRDRLDFIIKKKLLVKDVNGFYSIRSHNGDGGQLVGPLACLGLIEAIDYLMDQEELNG